MQTSPLAAAALGLALTACSDPGGVATETATQASTGAPTTTGDVPTTGTPTGTGTGDTTGEPGTSSTSSTSSTTGTPTTGEPSTGAGSSTGESCPEPLCGESAVCCLDTEKCSEGVCVPSCGSSGGLEFLDVMIEWAWTANESTVTPLVADIQGDPTPEVVVNAMRIDNISRDLGEIVALDGSTGAELWRIVDDPPKQRFGSHSLATPALADVDGDQRPDIIYAGRQDLLMYSLVHAVDGDGEHLWTGHTADDMPVAIRWDHGAAAVANLDDDPEAEVVIGGAIFDNDGLLVWNQDELGGQLGTPSDNKQPPKLLYVGGLPTLVDLTGDGKLELLTGREAWTIDWAPGPVVSLVLLWQNLDGKGNDGWPAVADIDQNGTPEVVLVAWPDIKVIDGATGKLWCGVDPTGVACEADEGLRTQPIKIEGGNLGGPAAIADLDGDGRPEVAIAGGTRFAVYDFNRLGEEIVLPQFDPMPIEGAMYVRWSQPTQDNSSAATGASVFDFQGDGAAEVAYQDECRVHVFDGRTGDPKLAINNSSGTVHEYPVIADVDGDEHAEFLVVANVFSNEAGTACKQDFPNHMTRKGLYVYRPQKSEWVATRKLWTQHTYHVTDAESSGSPPLAEQANWLVPGLNNFRQNVQGECK